MSGEFLQFFNNSLYTVTNNNRVKQIAAYKPSTIYGNVLITNDKQAKYSWTFKIHKQKKKDSICFGISSTYNINHNFWEDKSSSNYSICNDGKKGFKGAESKNWTKYCDKIKQGSTVQMILDCKLRQISFIINGKDYGVAFTDIDWGYDIKYRMAVWTAIKGEEIELIDFSVTNPYNKQINANIDGDEKVREITKKGQRSFMAELNELLNIIEKHINFMETQEQNVNDLIKKSDKPQLLFDAKRAALKTEKDLMQQIMNISKINAFLKDIILIENKFNHQYSEKQRELQKTARNTYDKNIKIYETKDKPLSKSNSFMDLLITAKIAHSSFKQLVKIISDKCEKEGIKIISNSGAKEKNIERAFYKSYYVYGAIYGKQGYEQMTDLLRCSIVFDNFIDLYKCYGIIEEITKSNGSGGILRVKDRFDPENIAFGYRDMLINVTVPEHGIICEIQLHHNLFYQHKKISHEMYKKSTTL